MKATFKSLAILYLIITPMVVFLGEAMAKAHGVFIFAWPDSNQICTESYFNRKSMVRKGLVYMLDKDKKVIATGTTSTEGIYCFERPESTGDLLFVIEAGEGHRAEFTLRKEDLPSMESFPADPPEVIVPKDETPVQDNKSAVEINETTIRNIIRDELKIQLGPINKTLAESRSQTPSFKEIIGGLGWLVGIFGLYFFLLGKKRQNSNKSS